jgi:hypothetical protein
MTEIEKAQFMARRTIHCDSRLVPLTYTPAQFDDAEPYEFAAEIKRTGRVVYDARGRRKRKNRVEHKRRVARRPVFRAVG